jgi:hypothetical protein
MQRRLGVYDKQEFDKLLALVKSQGAPRFNVKTFLRLLREVVEVSGYPLVNTEEAKLWRLISEEADLLPGEVIKELNSMLAAENPLRQDLCSVHLRGRVNAKLRNRWGPRWQREGRKTIPRVDAIIWSELTQSEQCEIREMIKDIRRYFLSFVSRHRPRKSKLDALLDETASLWLDQSRWHGDIHELPHSENSRFIQFASIALGPFADASETSRKALARRWQRRKQDCGEV